MVTVVIKGKRGSRTIEPTAWRRSESPAETACRILGSHDFDHDRAIHYAGARMKAHPRGSLTALHWFRTWQTLIRMRSGVSPQDTRHKPHLYGKMQRRGAEEIPPLVIPAPPET